MTSPHWPPFMLTGSVGQPSARRYGLGSPVGLRVWVCWLCALTTKVATDRTGDKQKYRST